MACGYSKRLLNENAKNFGSAPIRAVLFETFRFASKQCGSIQVVNSQEFPELAELLGARFLTRIFEEAIKTILIITIDVVFEN